MTSKTAKRPDYIRARSMKSLSWIGDYKNRKLFADGKKTGLILYQLDKPYMGGPVNKLAILPFFDTKSGIIHKWMNHKSPSGKPYKTWPTITMEYDLAIKLADAIYAMLGAKAPVVEVQDTRLSPQTGQIAPARAGQPLSEKDEIEMLSRKFRGA